MNYYNDKGAVKWIKYLIRKKLIPVVLIRWNHGVKKPLSIGMVFGRAKTDRVI